MKIFTYSEIKSCFFFKRVKKKRVFTELPVNKCVVKSG